MDKLTHADSSGKARMVDVGDKEVTARSATASGHLTMAAGTIKLVNENQLMKGDVLTVAQLAGISAAKETSRLIPLCHNIVLENVSLALGTDETGVWAESEVRCSGKTGVEMEALTAVSVALLTVYDMCKAVDKAMCIDRIVLTGKKKI